LLTEGVELLHEMVVVLGLVSTKHAELEPAEELLAKVRDAGRFHAIEQMAL